MAVSFELAYGGCEVILPTTDDKQGSDAAPSVANSQMQVPVRQAIYAVMNMMAKGGLGCGER